MSRHAAKPQRWGLKQTNRKYYMMTDDEIIHLFDSTNITLARLALISGRSVAQLKKLLMGQ